MRVSPMLPPRALRQPRPRDHLEASERSSLPQQSENEELQRGAGDPQLPAGGRGRVRVLGGEQDGEERRQRTPPVPWYGWTLREFSSGLTSVVCWLLQTKDRMPAVTG